jgi:quinol monooxygenase YgiN
MRIATTTSLLCALLATPVQHVLGQQAETAPRDSAVYAVAYFEVRASAASEARIHLKLYRNALQEQGAAHIDAFEQTGRPGHFAVVERWRDQAALDARDEAARKQLLGWLESVRVSGYDERTYKPLSTAPVLAGSELSIMNVVTHVDVIPNPQTAGMLERLAEAGRKEPGNLRFDVLQHSMRANHFTVIERWRNLAALDAHVAAAHTRQYRDELQPLTGSPLDERVYVSID